MVPIARTETQQAIFDLLQDGTERTAIFIAEILQVPLNRVQMALFFLVRRNAVHMIPRVILGNIVEVYSTSPEQEVERNHVR